MKQTIDRILADIKVDLGDKFDLNFDRQGFFHTRWQRSRRAEQRGGATLIDRGKLRKSIKVSRTATSITFGSDLPYAAIHNEGGEITVTAKMKRYFWAKYREATDAMTYKKNGHLRQNKRNRRLSADAEFYKAMALKKVGSKIIIPKRQFIGYSPEVERSVEIIIDRNMKEYLDKLNPTDK